MILEWLTPGLLALLVVITLWIAFRGNGHAAAAAASAELREAIAGAVRRDVQQLEREVRDEVSRSATATRQELVQVVGEFQRTLLAQHGDVARTQNDQIDGFRLQLVDQLRALGRANDERMNEVRATVEQKLAAIQANNEKKLDEMRATVDEKLHDTLEKRLGESFSLVAERLEQVHRGIGEMQKLATDVGSLNRVLTNVRSRGVFGEVQLGALLDQVLTIEQYATNVETIPASGSRVEFAVKLPGRRDDRAPLWLPIDCKFPREDYERLIDAQEAADKPAMESAGRALENRLKAEAKSIREKYVAPPHTTDFAILFVPTEGLYAEALRRPGLVEGLQREHKIMLTGPTTLLATLSSLQMGFRTLALEQRSAEVWETLGAVKTEFAKFGEVLAKTKKKLDEASSSIDMAERRTRVMARELREVEAIPDSLAQALLPGMLSDDELDG